MNKHPFMNHFNMAEQGEIQITEDKKTPKLELWERKLLDLTLHNNLLNLRPNSKTLPFISFSIDKVADLLQGGEPFKILPLSDGTRFTVSSNGFPSSSQFAYNEADITRDLQNHRLHSYIEASKLNYTQTCLYLDSRNAIEENGGNNLFLAVGMLQWVEAKNEKTHLAPILLFPIEFVRTGSKITYAIHARDEEIMPNFALIEYLRREEYNIDLSELKELTKDDSNIDINRALQCVREAISDKENWLVLEEMALGLFSFNKFVMWNDVHTHSEQLVEHPIVESLIDSRLHIDTDLNDINISELDRTQLPSQYNIPIDVDSSQLEAIIASGEGKSFVLHGPPGTGKSQTITNIIANALYHNKRVLFVSEKMAALNVVMSRLDKIGIRDFCLELHSNKSNKSSFLGQLSSALQVAHSHTTFDLEYEAQRLFEKRQELNNLIVATHAKHDSGFSLYDCISEYLKIEGEAIHIVASDLPAQLDTRAIDQARTTLIELDSIFKTLEHPATNPLNGIYIVDGTPEAEEQFERCLLADYSELTTQWRNIKQKWFVRRYFAKKKFLVALLKYDFIKSNNIDTILSNIEAVQKYGKMHFREWYTWCTKRRELIDAGFECAVDYLEKSKHTGRETAEALTKGIFRAAAKRIINTNEQLRFFNGAVFERTIEKYRALTTKFQTLSQQELFCKLAARVPSSVVDYASSSEPAILQRFIRNKGRSIPIRKMIEKIPNLLPRLCPCMLMSPISVAQYIDLNNDKFDIVIFDEASQMPTCEAVGAIARGKTLICVGDPKQLPPTNFFKASHAEEEELEDDDLESILDDCLALGLPSRYLKYHYRSKHESLIAFCNSEYYDNQLITFPSADDRQSKITLRQIDGVYDRSRTRTNLQEAEAIIEELVRRSKDPELSTQTIGVVAFSKEQQSLISNLLWEECAHNNEFNDFVLFNGNDINELLFVKNLENVQGDERDVILFSIGYGPDATGKVLMNFGPLNKTGGERRLNVALSRARYEMIVYTSLHPEDIDLERTQSLGAKGLKKFLEYAASSSTCSTQKSTSAANPITESIASELNARGYRTATNIGRSQFKIDIAVIDPNDNDKYILGIVCDTDDYAAMKTERDREVVHPAVLRQLNWNMMHVWAVDWFERRENVIDSILSKLEEILKSPIGTPEPSEIYSKDEDLQIPSIVEDDRDEAQPPSDANTYKRDIQHIPTNNLEQAMLQIVEQQISIERDDLRRLTAQRFGFARVGSNINARTERIIDSLISRQLIEENDGRIKLTN